MWRLPLRWYLREEGEEDSLFDLNVVLREKLGMGTKGEEGDSYLTPCVETSNSCCPCCGILSDTSSEPCHSGNSHRDILRFFFLFTPLHPLPWNENGDLVTGLPRGLYALSPSPLEEGGAFAWVGEEIGISEEETLN